MEKKFIDWHSADIIAALRKKGTSLAAESRRNGLSSSTLANALTRPWPKGELIIATALEPSPGLYGLRVTTTPLPMNLSTEHE
ncbi:DNA-binding transcriptional regulator Nlp [Lelliottia amnigena]|nr:DNA-binding transcriptional regulator Nlp [Lelliottia amnigena]